MFNKIIFFLFLLLISFGAYRFFIHSPNPVINIKEKSLKGSILDMYGFNTKEKKEALKDILRQANILKENKKLFKGDILKRDILPCLIQFVQDTQDKLFIRSGSQERWEVSPAQWMSKNKKSNIKNLTILGFIKAVEPKYKTPDAVCLLGSSRPTMVSRIKYLEKLLSKNVKTKSVILLTGERCATLGIDGSEEELTLLARRFGKFSYKDLKEEDMMQQVYEDSAIYNKYPTYVLNTPAGNLRRATTKTTIKTLATWLKNHKKIKTILFISGQPNVSYQKQTITNVLQEEGCNIKYEVVGAGIKLQDTIKGPVGALGSFIWSKTPIIIKKLGLLPNHSEKETLKRLFPGSF